MTRLEFATMLMVCLATGACAAKPAAEGGAAAVVPGNAAAPSPGADVRPAVRTAPRLRSGEFVPGRFIDIGGSAATGGRPSMSAI